MFDNIHFLKLDLAKLLMEDDVSEFWYSIEDYKNLEDREMYTAAMNADYSTSSTVFCIPLRLVSSFAKANYLYLQHFGLLQSDEKFYTRREQYDSFLILYTYSGTGYLEYEGKEYYLNEGDGCFINCYKPHYYRANGKVWHHSDMHFNGTLANNLFQMFEKSGSVKFTSSDVRSYQNLLENLLNIYNQAPPYMELQISNLLYQIVTEILVKTDKLSAKASPMSETLKYLIRYMESNYKSKLTLDYLSKFAGISKYHLSREFKKFTGLSPNEYLIHLRIEQAKLLLQNTNISVEKISQLVGIPDENNFTHHFKRLEGTTPGNFRAH